LGLDTRAYHLQPDSGSPTMNKRILYATTNPAKITHMRNLLISFPVDILSLADAGITTQIPEIGDTPAENARQKVEFAYSKCGIPTMAVDNGLYIESFPKDKQPGLFVRRIYGKEGSFKGGTVSDEEMLKYYQNELKAVGGQSKGTWVTAVAFRIDILQIYAETFISETLFTAKKSPLVMAGEPLNSLQIDPASGVYFSEMSPEERIKAQRQRASGIIRFMEKHWNKL
jgi:XTP/dITP diphosphohydrolase